MGRLYIYLHIYHKKSTIHVGKLYNRPMEPSWVSKDSCHFGVGMTIHPSLELRETQENQYQTVTFHPGLITNKKNWSYKMYTLEN